MNIRSGLYTNKFVKHFNKLKPSIFFASRYIKVDEYDPLRGLYIIKLKRDIYMLDTNYHIFSEGKKLT